MRGRFETAGGPGYGGEVGGAFVGDGDRRAPALQQVHQRARPDEFAPVDDDHAGALPLEVLGVKEFDDTAGRAGAQATLVAGQAADAGGGQAVDDRRHRLVGSVLG
jgi:hypothetical protein